MGAGSSERHEGPGWWAGDGAARPLPASGETYYAALADAINAQIESVYHCAVTLVQYPSQGGFPWYYQNPNQVFNAATFGYLSARVMPGDAPGLVALSPAGGFPNAYARLLADLTYSAGPPGLGSPVALGQSELAEGAALLAQLLQTTTAPDESNGGMQTVDPATGTVSATWQVGYSVNTPLASIQAALADPACALTVTVSGSVRIVYPGYTLVSVSPTPWQQATGVGWFYPDPVSEAFQNAGQGTAGFQFTDPPPYQPGPPTAGGDVGWLTSLLISAMPQVSVCSPSGSPVSAAQVRLADDILDGLSLLGLPPPTRAAPGLGRPSRRRRSARGARRVGAQPGVPVLQQTAYVIGAVVGFPGAQ